MSPQEIALTKQLEAANKRIEWLGARLAAAEAALAPAERLLEIGVRLTPLERKVLGLLLHHAPKVVSRERIFARCWGYESERDDKGVDVQLAHLRKKLPPGVTISRVWGEGWFLDAESARRLREISEAHTS